MYLSVTNTFDMNGIKNLSYLVDENPTRNGFLASDSRPLPETMLVNIADILLFNVEQWIKIQCIISTDDINITNIGSSVYRSSMYL